MTLLFTYVPHNPRPFSHDAGKGRDARPGHERCFQAAAGFGGLRFECCRRASPDLKPSSMR